MAKQETHRPRGQIRKAVPEPDGEVLAAVQRAMREVIRRRVPQNDRDDVLQEALIAFLRLSLASTLRDPLTFAKGVARMECQHWQASRSRTGPVLLGDKDLALEELLAESTLEGEDGALLREYLLARLPELPLRARRVAKAVLEGCRSWHAIARATGMETSEVRRQFAKVVEILGSPPAPRPRATKGRGRKSRGAGGPSSGFE